jgi:hypothetical protein
MAFLLLGQHKSQAVVSLAGCSQQAPEKEAQKGPGKQAYHYPNPKHSSHLLPFSEALNNELYSIQKLCHQLYLIISDCYISHLHQLCSPFLTKSRQQVRLITLCRIPNGGHCRSYLCRGSLTPVIGIDADVVLGIIAGIVIIAIVPGVQIDGHEKRPRLDDLLGGSFRFRT